jgi:hypothetical protein
MKQKKLTLIYVLQGEKQRADIVEDASKKLGVIQWLYDL